MDIHLPAMNKLGDGQRHVREILSAPPCTMLHMDEIVFIIEQESDGGYVAEALGHGIVTQGDDWSELRSNVREAVDAYFFDSKAPSLIRLHLVRDEVLIPA